jgi:hypothetical protein
MNEDFELEISPTEPPKTKEEVITDCVLRSLALYEEAEQEYTVSALQELVTSLLLRLRVTAELKALKDGKS